MRTVERKTDVVLLAIILAIAVVPSVAQSSKPKPSTSNLPAKQKHSNDEIADWIVSRATFNDDASPFSTSVSKSPDACNLRITTKYLKNVEQPVPADQFHPQGRLWVVRFDEEAEYQVPLASINPRRISSGNNGAKNVLTTCSPMTGVTWNPHFENSPTVVLHTTNDKGAVQCTSFHTQNMLDDFEAKYFPVKSGPGSIDSAEFYVKDEEIAKRIVNAFKDLIAQCGGAPDKAAKPPNKDIY
jgi:hypothetical protein